MARLTDSMLKSIMPLAPAGTRKAAIPFLEHTAAHYDIITAPRLRMWLATLAAESGELRYQEEIASGAAYENREDLGNTHAGDGRRFKGRGRIQGTGRDVYAAYTAYLKKSGHLPFVNFVTSPQRLAEEPYATDFSGWFVNGYKNLNPLADAGNFLAYQVRVNGRNKNTGKPNNWPERQRYYERAINAIPSTFELSIPSGAPDITEEARAALESTDGYPDFDVIEPESKDIQETPNGADEGSVSSPEPQPLVNPASPNPNASGVQETPAIGTSGAAQPEPKVDTPQNVTKEKPSLFVRVMTAIGMTISGAVASITATCGGTQVAQIVQQKGTETVIENATRSDWVTLGLVLAYVALGLGSAVAILYIYSRFHDRSATRATALNNTKLTLAGDRDKNTVEFTQNVPAGKE